jgi:O-antigen/teichoic acid export membrane protein
MALNFFWYPVSVKMWQENRATYLKYFRLLFSHGILVLFFILLLLEANSRLILSVFARKPEYQSVYPYLSLIAFAFIMQVLITILTAPLYADEKPRWILLSNFAGALSSVVLNLLLIPPLGILGASITAAASFLIVVVMLVFGIYRFSVFPFLENRCLFSLFFVITLWALLALLRDRLTWGYGLLASLLLFLAGLPLLYAFFLNEEEKKFVLERGKQILSFRSSLKKRQ